MPVFSIGEIQEHYEERAKQLTETERLAIQLVKAHQDLKKRFTDGSSYMDVNQAMQLQQEQINNLIAHLARNGKL